MVRGPRNKAFENALRAAAKKKVEDDKSSKSNEAAEQSSVFSKLFDPESTTQRKSHQPRVRKHRSRKKKLATQKPLNKKYKNFDSGPSVEAIRSAYGSLNKKKRDSESTSKLMPDTGKRLCLSDEFWHSKPPDALVSWQYCGSKSTQFERGNSKNGYIDLVIGLDFGTTFTKVILREPGSRLAWAVPFTDSKENPYLLPGNVEKCDEDFRASITQDLTLGSLKMAVLDGEADTEHLTKVVAYLAMVIRHARGWFLAERSDEFGVYEIGWSYHMGLPASSYSNKEIVRIFRSLLESAVLLSTDSRWVDEASFVGRGIAASVWSSVIQKDGLSDQEWSEDLVEVDVYPEIAAQLHGHVASDAWDSSTRKFVLVDVGSGTVDSTMVNISKSDDEWRYSFLSTSVDLLGTLILHRERIAFLHKAAASYPLGGKEVQQRLAAPDIGLGGWVNVPSSIGQYVDKNSDSAYLGGFDRQFRNRFHGEITDMIRKAKKRDIRTSHKELPLVLCGGGSKNQLYQQYALSDLSAMSVSLIQLSMEKPSGVSMPLTMSSEFHRLSVAYGLAFEELAQVVGEEYFGDPSLDPELQKTELSPISKDDV